MMDEAIIRRYQNDPVFHRMVDSIADSMRKFNITPSDWVRAVECALELVVERAVREREERSR
jgi:hypothetical protein